MRGIRYRSEGDVTVLLVRDYESEWTVTGATIAATSKLLVAAFAISCLRGEEVRLFEYPANYDKTRRLHFATGPKLGKH